MGWNIFMILIQIDIKIWGYPGQENTILLARQGQCH